MFLLFSFFVFSLSFFFLSHFSFSLGFIIINFTSFQKLSPEHLYHQSLAFPLIFNSSAQPSLVSYSPSHSHFSKTQYEILFPEKEIVF
jgi:pyruvate dehydrogenase complex dehydrogenase (E1) component